MSYARTGSTVGMHEEKLLAEFSQLWALVTINLFICAWLLKNLLIFECLLKLSYCQDIEKRIYYNTLIVTTTTRKKNNK